MIPVLIGCGTLIYSIFWLRYHGSGLHLRFAPDLRPLGLLLLAAALYVACEIAGE
ncbi:MAG: hypothetical protein JW910_19895 [Anaerolineae bacterium]|nr:hypothetical protein [Anaerolineae bacterium]